MNDFNYYDTDMAYADYLKHDIEITEGMRKAIREQQKQLRIRRKRRRTLLKAVIGTALILITFLLLNRLGTEIRGYFAIGGEGLIFLLPFIIVLVVDSWHEIIDLFKR